MRSVRLKRKRHIIARYRCGGPSAGTHLASLLAEKLGHVYHQLSSRKRYGAKRSSEEHASWSDLMAYTPRIKLVTDFPVAYESLDHLVPWGTRRDSSQNPAFNAKLYRFFSDLRRPLRVLDLGCSGGGFVRDCINDGCLGVGIEGSDYSKRMKRAEWAYLADHFLFTADITKPFSITDADSGEIIKFDVITSWEVLEHLDKEQLPRLIENVKRHLNDRGIFVASISYVSDIIDGVELHRTIEKENWWLPFFETHKLYSVEGALAYFNSQYVRGPKQAAPGSFHVCLSPTAHLPLKMPTLSLKDRLLDAWYFSLPHRVLRRLITMRG